MKNFSEAYLKIITTDFYGLNLTRILDPHEFQLKQYEDSLLPFKALPELMNIIKDIDLICDIGFGGGFPLLPLATFFPSKKLIGLEARRKKAEAVQEIAKQMNLTNVQTYHKRSEEILFDRKAFITLKAVGKIPVYLEKINALEETYVLFYKGPNVEEQEQTDGIPGWEQILNRPVNLEGAIGRNILLYRSKKVPRGTNSFDKNLVKVSNIL